MARSAIPLFLMVQAEGKLIHTTLIPTEYWRETTTRTVLYLPEGRHKEMRRLRAPMGHTANIEDGAQKGVPSALEPFRWHVNE